MAFPKKFKQVLETKRGEVSEPDDVWLSYAVCGVFHESCGWKGWTLESVKEKGEELKAQTGQRCPNCQMPLFRTEVAVRLFRADDQSPPLVEGIDYESGPMEYE